MIPPPSKRKPNGSSQSSRQSSQSEFASGGSQKHHFGRQNRLDDLLSSQTSGLSQSNTKKSKSSRNSVFEEDEGFIYKRMDSQEKPAKKPGNDNRRKSKQISTPVSRLNQALDDLPGSDLDSVDSLEFEENPAKRLKGGRKFSNFSDDELDEPEPEVVKLSSPIRPRYEADGEDPNTKGGIRRGYKEDTSSDDYMEQVSHHKLDLTGGEDDLMGNNHSFDNRKSKNSGNDRRSSYNNRGKRILSIGNGFVGLPHEDVSAKDYYKLLDTSLPEPHRMKQLLIWCMSKRIKEDENKKSRVKSKASASSSPDEQAIINIAKVIKEEVLQDLREGQVNTSWYYRLDDDDDNARSVITNKEIVLPNPLNIKTKDNISHFTKELTKLRREKEQWKKLYKKHSQLLNNISGTINGKFDSKDLPKLKQYFKNKNPELNEQILNEKLIVIISRNYEQLQEKFLDNLEDSIDRLNNFTHQLTKLNEVIENYKSSKLNPKISELTRNYVNKTKFENFKQLDTSNSLWPVPNKPLGVRELLQGIAQLEYSALQFGSSDDNPSTATTANLTTGPSIT